MPETTQFTIGAEATCSDGPCGAVIKVVVNPVAQTVTHIVIEPKHRAGLGRLVPLDLLEDASDEIRLRCTLAEFETLPIAEEIQLLPGSGYAGYSTGSGLVIDVTRLNSVKVTPASAGFSSGRPLSIFFRMR